MRVSGMLRILSIVLMVVSPWVVYLALTRGTPQLAGCLLIVWLVLRAIPSWLNAKPEQRQATLTLPAIGVAFALLGMCFENGLIFRIIPSLTNFAFAAAFFGSLRGTPLIEHFARMVKPNLPEPEVRYCRTLTKVWGFYVIALGITGVTLAIVAPVRIWAAYAGGISYLLVGLLFAVEYAFRKLKFRDAAPNRLDASAERVAPRGP